MTARRREALTGLGAGLGMLGAAGLAAAPAQAPAQAALDPGAMVAVTAFGAKGDGIADDTAAFRAAIAAATAQGKAVFVPGSRAAYRITDTLAVTCRRIVGECDFVAADSPGSALKFDPPGGGADLMPCLDLVRGMYDGGGVENLAVVGNHAYARERMIEAIPNPGALPDYQAFAPGLVAIRVAGSNQPTFRNVTTRDVKVGLLLDSANGHVSSYDSTWFGLFGIYCHRNSEDYFFMGGAISGIFAGVVFGTFDQANHNGGFGVNMVRVHMGFSPYGFYQVRDAAFTGPASSLYGRLDSVRFERIGEAIIQVLPESVTRWLAIDGFAMSWSPIYRGFPQRPADGWVTNLPPEVLPYDQQQQHMFRFGTLADNVQLSWLGDFVPLRRSQYATQPGALALVERLQPGETSNLAALGGDIAVRQDIRSDSWLRRRPGPAANRGEFSRDSAVAPQANLLVEPERAGNWQAAGGAVRAMALSQTGPAPLPPVEFIEDLAGDPVVIELDSGGGPAMFRLMMTAAAANPANLRPLYLGLWLRALGGAPGGPVRANLAVELGAGGGWSGAKGLPQAGPGAPGRFYPTAVNLGEAWQRVTCLDQMPPAPPRALVIALAAGARVLVAGAMAAWGGPVPYNPRNRPRVRGGLALDLPDLAPPSPVPAVPTGWLMVEIDGVMRRLPYY